MFPHVLFTGHVTLTSLCNVCMNGGWSSKTRTQYPLVWKFCITGLPSHMTWFGFLQWHFLIGFGQVTLLFYSVFISKCLPYRAWWRSMRPHGKVPESVCSKWESVYVFTRRGRELAGWWVGGVESDGTVGGGVGVAGLCVLGLALCGSEQGRAVEVPGPPGPPTLKSSVHP